MADVLEKDKKPEEGKQPEEQVLEKLNITPDQCFEYFKNYINNDKPGLKQFYGDDVTLRKVAGQAVEMAETLWDNGKGCTVEIARDMQILMLYDLVMLIDDSTSILFDDEPAGVRLETLEKTLTVISEIYANVRSEGIISVRFLNDNTGKKNVLSKSVNRIVKKHSWRGVTRIGTELERKILDAFVYEPRKKGETPKPKKLDKPLLIMTITDGKIEGEPGTTLQSVIFNCVKTLKKTKKEGGFGKHGADTVAFHFSRVGKDEGAADLLRKLDDDPEIGLYVDCLPVDEPSCLENLINGDREVKWNVLAKLLLGAIHPHWDSYDGGLLPHNPVELNGSTKNNPSEIIDEDCDEDIDDDDEKEEDDDDDGAVAPK